MSTSSPPVGIANWGPLVIGPDIDNAILGALREWAPTYLTQIRKERNLSFQPAIPRVYTNTYAGQEFVDHRLPACICITARLTATRGGQNRTYEGTWQSRVATVLRAKNPQSTRFMAGLYEGVFRRLVLQKARGDGVDGSSDGPINDLHYMGMSYEEIPDATGKGRYSLAAVSTFDVFTDQIVQPYAGPDVPDAETYLDEATVTEVDIEVLGESLVINGSS